MEIRNHATSMVMHKRLVDMLRMARAVRAFDAAEYVSVKAVLLNDYLRRAGLKSVVVAVSGGIDSAVVLGIAQRARNCAGSPIEHIAAISLPSHGTKGVTGQDVAQSDAQVVADHFGIPLSVIDMAPIVQSITGAVETATGMKSSDWAEGQVVSYARTPTYYYVTSLLAAAKKPGVVLGTTNLSEGGYLGYFGKASDGMVDVQMISDIFKSEVYAVAEELGIPEAIRTKAPTGDMFDATTDEVVFGAPYDFVELYLTHLREFDNPRTYIARMLGGEVLEQYHEYASNLDRMHAYNAHKYLGRSPAVHLDVLPCAIPGGWNNEPPKLERPAIQISKMVNPVGLSQLEFMLKYHSNLGERAGRNIHPEALQGIVPEDSIVMADIFTGKELTSILDEISSKSWLAVPRDGFKVDRELADDEIGSYRLTAHSQHFADVIWSRLKPYLPKFRIMYDETPTDHEGHPLWKPIGVSPVHRFIRYKDGGSLVPHYDSTFIENDRQRTLMSLVIALQINGEQGTRFIKDPQVRLPVKERDLNDWTRHAGPEDILFEFRTHPGLAFAFDHRILHDSPTITGPDDKIILRTDVIFERCNWYAAS